MIIVILFLHSSIPLLLHCRIHLCDKKHNIAIHFSIEDDEVDLYESLAKLAPAWIPSTIDDAIGPEGEVRVKAVLLLGLLVDDPNYVAQSTVASLLRDITKKVGFCSNMSLIDVIVLLFCITLVSIFLRLVVSFEACDIECFRKLRLR